MLFLVLPTVLLPHLSQRHVCLLLRVTPGPHHLRPLNLQWRTKPDLSIHAEEFWDLWGHALAKTSRLEQEWFVTSCSTLRTSYQKNAIQNSEKIIAKRISHKPKAWSKMATDFPDQANENVFSGKSREPPLFDECELATTSRVPTFNGHLSIGEVLCIGITKNEHFFVSITLRVGS